MLRRLLYRFSRKPRGETQVSLPLVPFVLDPEDLNCRIEGYLDFVTGVHVNLRMMDCLPLIDRAIAMTIGQKYGCQVAFTPAALVDGDEGPELVQEFHVLYPPVPSTYRLHIQETEEGVHWSFRAPTPDEMKVAQGLGIPIVTAEE